jgi:hypothetical protein
MQQALPMVTSHPLARELRTAAQRASNQQLRWSIEGGAGRVLQYAGLPGRLARCRSKGGRSCWRFRGE